MILINLMFNLTINNFKFQKIKLLNKILLVIPLYKLRKCEIIIFIIK